MKAAVRVLLNQCNENAICIKNTCARVQAIVDAYFIVIPRKLTTEKFVSQITRKLAKNDQNQVYGSFFTKMSYQMQKCFITIYIYKYEEVWLFRNTTIFA